MLVKPSFVEPETGKELTPTADAWKRIQAAGTEQSVPMGKAPERDLWKELVAATPDVQPPDPYPTTEPLDQSEEAKAERLRILREIVGTVAIPSKRRDVAAHVGQMVLHSFGDQLVAGGMKAHGMTTAESARLMTQVGEVLGDAGYLYGLSHPAKTVLAATMGPPYRKKVMEVEKPASEYMMFEAGAAVSDWLREHLPGDKRFRNSFWLTQVPEGFGSMAAFMLGTAVLGGVGLPSWIAAAGLGAGVGATSGYDEARIYGADEETALTAARWDGILGTSNAFPISRIFSRLDRPTGGLFRARLGKALRLGAYGTVEEGIQEAGEETGRNIVAKMYDENRELFDGVAEAGGAGGIIGFTMNMIAGMVGGRRRGGFRARELPEPQLSTKGLPAEELLKPESITELVAAAPDAARKIASLTDPTRKAVGDLIPGADRWSKAERMKLRDMVAAALETGTAAPEAAKAVPGAKALAEEAEPGMGPETATEEPGDVLEAFHEGAVERPDVRTAPVQGVGELSRTILRPIELPELIHFTRELMGRVPRVLKRMAAAAKFTVRKIQGVPVTELLLRAQEAGDSEAVAGIIGHEIGHWIDYVPHGTLGRGNILGRIISSHRRWVAKYAHEAPHAAAGKMSEKAVREELEKLTEWWSGPIEGTPEQQAARRKPRELYAEAVSVLLTAPTELQERAPRFARGFMNWLGTKPAVQQELMKHYDMLMGSPEETAERRSKWVREMFKRGEDAATALRNAGRVKWRTPMESIQQTIEMLVWQSGGPAMKAVERGVGKPGAMTEAEYEKWKHEFYHILTKSEGPVRVAMSDVQAHVADPLMQAGLHPSDLAEYLFHCNVVGMRGEIASPGGFTPEPSAAQVEHMRKDLGPEKFEVLQRAAKRFHDIFFERASVPAVESGLVSRQMFEKVFVPNRDVYATFAITKYLEGENLPPEIYARYGTFEDAGDTYTSTLLKLTSLIRAGEHNKISRDLVRALEQNTPELVKSEFFEEGWSEKRRKPDPGYAWITYKDDGKLKRAMVPDHIALAVNRRDTGAVEGFVNLLNSNMYRYFHPLYTFLRASFLLGNPTRDLRRVHRSLSAERSKMVRQEKRLARAQRREPREIPPVYMHDIIREAASTIPQVRRHLSGKWDEEIQRLIETGALAETMVSQVPILAGQSEVGPETQPTRPSRDLGDQMRESQQKAIRGVGRVYGFGQDVMAVEEYASKMAANRMLRRMGYSEEEAAYSTATKMGTPDYTAGGEGRSYINFHPMYGNVMVQGVVQDMGLAFNRDTAPGWWSSLMRWAVVPAVLRYGAIAGAFGGAAQAIMKLTPQYYMTQYVVLPLGRLMLGDKEKEEKAVILTFASDPIEQFAGNVTYRLCELLGEQMGIGPDGERDPERVRRYALDLVSTLAQPLLREPNPMVSTMWRWGQYLTRHQPWDSFYDRPIVPDRFWDAGIGHELRYMASWTIDKTGALAPVLQTAAAPLLREPLEGEEPSSVRYVRGVLEVAGIGRYLRITSGGLQERQWAEVENQYAERKRWNAANVPPDARRRTTRRHLLNRLTGTKLTNQERIEKLLLNSWFNDVYRPTCEEIKLLEEQDGWDEAEVLRDRMVPDPEPRPELLARQLGEPIPRGTKPDEIAERRRDTDAVLWHAHEQGIDLVKLRATYKQWLRERYKSVDARRIRLKSFDQVVGGGDPIRRED